MSIILLRTVVSPARCYGFFRYQQDLWYWPVNRMIVGRFYSPFLATSCNSLVMLYLPFSLYYTLNDTSCVNHSGGSTKYYLHSKTKKDCWQMRSFTPVHVPFSLREYCIAAVYRKKRDKKRETACGAPVRFTRFVSRCSGLVRYAVFGLKKGFRPCARVLYF